MSATKLLAHGTTALLALAAGRSARLVGRAPARARRLARRDVPGSRPDVRYRPRWPGRARGRALRCSPKHVHVVNIEPRAGDVPDWMEVDNGDACELPDLIANAPVRPGFSNSVIEHVGGHERRLRFAESVHTLADRALGADAVPLLPDRAALDRAGHAVPAGHRCARRWRSAGRWRTRRAAPATRR